MVWESRAGGGRELCLETGGVLPAPLAMVEFVSRGWESAASWGVSRQSSFIYQGELHLVTTQQGLGAGYSELPNSDWEVPECTAGGEAGFLARMRSMDISQMGEEKRHRISPHFPLETGFL